MGDYLATGGGSCTTKPPKKNGAEVIFRNVCVDANGKRILWNISGQAVPGQLLALMGPSGSGKTTLLNALSGNTPLASGRIEMNSVALSKRMKRKISYVQQADIFFPNLTLRETLRYSALIRLPSELSFRQKLIKVEEIIATLHLQDCAETCIGNDQVRGLSGGETKRANIGCELLTDPSLLLLDEPTSGLDSTSAVQLLELLREQLAMKENKTIIMSIHQPSSQMYYMFEKLLLLAKGKVAYFGPVCDAMTYFSSVGLHCDLQYNPADYMMDLVSDKKSRKILIGEDPRQDNKQKTRSKWQCVFQWCRQGLSYRNKEARFDDCEGRCEHGDERCDDAEMGQGVRGRGEENGRLGVDVSKSLAMQVREEAEDVQCGSLDDKPTHERESVDTNDSIELSSSDHKWPTPWWWQVCVLTVRTFRQSRHTILSKTNLFLTISVCIITSLVWFQIPETEESITDRTGILYFTLTFWSFDLMFTALFAFPVERVVINKERSSGSYRLSAYYLAKTLSELPLIFLRPSLFIVIVYWITGLNGWAGFFGSWFFLLYSGFMMQSLGLLIGAAVINLDVALTIGVITVITCMLLAGFFVENLPTWLTWAQDLSFVTYGYDALLQLEFSEDRRFSCSDGASSYASCNTTESDTGNLTISGPDVLQELGGVHPLHVCFLAILAFSVLFRTLAYLSLRFLHDLNSDHCHQSLDLW